MSNALINPAMKICGMLSAASDMKLDQEILVLDEQTVGIVVDIDGVDYILTMMRVPKQRMRPTAN